MPTRNFGWELPPLGAGSWFESFFWGFPHSVEAALHPIAEIPQTRLATVLSAFAGNSLRLSWLAFATTYTTISCAPYGQFVGSFSITRSGRAAYFRFGCDFVGPDHSAVAAGQFADAGHFFRGIVMPGSVEVGGSSWVMKAVGVEGVPHDGGQRSVSFTALVPNLAAGDYSVRWQVLAQLNNATDSAFAFWPGHDAWATVAEVVAG